MDKIVKTYNILIVRERGADPLTGEIYGRAEEELLIDATSLQAAHTMAQVMTTLKFRGQSMRIFIDGKEHYDESI